MGKVVTLVALGFAAILVLPAFNDLWRTLGTTLIDLFGVTPDSPTGITFFLWVRAMPYIIIAVVVFMAFRIIRGSRNDGPDIKE